MMTNPLPHGCVPTPVTPSQTLLADLSLYLSSFSLEPPTPRQVGPNMSGSRKRNLSEKQSQTFHSPLPKWLVCTFHLLLANEMQRKTLSLRKRRCSFKGDVKASSGSRQYWMRSDTRCSCSHLHREGRGLRTQAAH